MNQADNLSPLSLAQLQLPNIESKAQSSPAADGNNRLVTIKVPRTSDSARPFHNFDSFQAASMADFIPIPAQFPEPEQPFAQHEAFTSVEGGTNTPDSGYDSNWNAAVRNQEPYGQCHHAFAHTVPFAPLPDLEQQQQQQPQSVFDPRAVLTEARHSSLEGYYGLFQSRNVMLDAGMMDSSLVYLENAGGIGTSDMRGRSRNAGNGAVM